MILFTGLVVFVSAYFLLAPRYGTVKQRAWILTTLSSAFMTLVSTPLVYGYVSGGFSVTSIPKLPSVTLPAIRLFQAYLIAYVFFGNEGLYPHPV